MVASPSLPPLALARQLVDQVQDDPGRARDQALGLLDRSDLDPHAAVVARWALGRACHELDQVDAAVSALEVALANALTLAPTDQLREDAASIRVSLSVCLFAQGDGAGARHQLDRAEPDLSGGPRGRAIMQRALIEHRSGNEHQAVALFDQAMPLLEGAGDVLAQARLLANRGALLTYLGRWGDAEHDFEQQVGLATQLDQRLVVASAQHNLAFLHGRMGDLPRSLAEFEQARVQYRAAGNPGRLVAALDADVVEVLVAAGLWAEAAERARALAEGNQRRGNRPGEAEARLRLAEACLALGQREEAGAAARLAHAAFEASDRSAWAALASYVGLQADAPPRPVPVGSLLGEAGGSDGSWAPFAAVAEVLASQGWVRQAARAQLEAGQRALAVGRRAEATKALEAVAGHGRSSVAELKIMAWHAEALRRLAAGNRPGAERALVAGLGQVGRHRATLGATELRVGSAWHGQGLARLGLDLAFNRRHRQARSVLLWNERLKAGATQLHRVAPSEDAELEEALAELRRQEMGWREATAAGEDPGDRPRQLARQEGRVASISRRSRGSAGSDRGVLTGAGLNRLLAETGVGQDVDLVEYVIRDDHLWAVVVSRGRARLRALGPVAEAETSIDHLLFALRRAAFGVGGSRQANGVEASLRRSLDDLDRILVQPLGLGDREVPVVVVPSGRLHDLPWSGLPGLRGRVPTVTPSFTRWARPPRPAPPDRSALLVAGPDLAAAPAEVEAIAAARTGPAPTVTLTGRAASPGEVLARLPEFDVAHVAAHGLFQEQSPMFSALVLHGGRLSVYDLERLPAGPRTVILPACNAARSAVAFDHELLGTAGALLSIGVESVVAPLVPVPDGPTAVLMPAVHRDLQAGLAPAAAIDRLAAGAWAHDSLATTATALAFVCFGTRGGGFTPG